MSVKKSAGQRNKEKAQNDMVTPAQLLQLAWNNMIQKVLAAEGEWKTLSSMLKDRRVSIGDLPIALQTHISKFSPSMHFEVFLDLAVGYGRGLGGMHKLLVDPQMKLFEDEDQDDNQQTKELNDA